MSKGPGRVMRAVLETLEKREPEDAYTLALWCDARPDSVGRALRKLRRSGAVVFLGFSGRGVGVWCLPEQEAQARADMLPPDLWPDIVRLLGVRGAHKLARNYTGGVVDRWKK